MYRVTCYLAHPSGDITRAIPFRSAGMRSLHEVEALYTRVMAMPDVTGGRIEVHVPGIGWTLPSKENTPK